MIDIDLDELERLAKAATPGPWHERTIDGSNWSIDDENDDQVCQMAQRGSFTHQIKTNHAERHANTAFVVAANPAVILELIRRVREK